MPLAAVGEYVVAVLVRRAGADLRRCPGDERHDARRPLRGGGGAAAHDRRLDAARSHPHRRGHRRPGRRGQVPDRARLRARLPPGRDADVHPAPRDDVRRARRGRHRQPARHRPARPLVDHRRGDGRDHAHSRLHPHPALRRQRRRGRIRRRLRGLRLPGRGDALATHRHLRPRAHGADLRRHAGLLAGDQDRRGRGRPGPGSGWPLSSQPSRHSTAPRHPRRAPEPSLGHGAGQPGTPGWRPRRPRAPGRARANRSAVEHGCSARPGEAGPRADGRGSESPRCFRAVSGLFPGCFRTVSRAPCLGGLGPARRFGVGAQSGPGPRPEPGQPRPR